MKFLKFLQKIYEFENRCTKELGIKIRGNWDHSNIIFKNHRMVDDPSNDRWYKIAEINL
jgi:hypothetical protein